MNSPESLFLTKGMNFLVLQNKEYIQKSQVILVEGYGRNKAS